MKPTPQKKLNWNLNRLMQSKGWTSSRLAADLNSLGYQVSEAHVARIASQPPKRVDFDLITKLCKILDCKTKDLLAVNNRPDTYFEGQIDNLVCQREGCCVELRIEKSAGAAFSVITWWQDSKVPVDELAKAFLKDKNSFGATLIKTIGRDSIQLINNVPTTENPFIDTSTAEEGFVSLLFLKKRSLLNKITTVHGYTLLGVLDKFAPQGLNNFSETPWIPIEDIYTLFGQSREMYPGNLNRFVVAKAVLAVNNADLGLRVAAEKQVVNKKIKWFRFVED